MLSYVLGINLMAAKFVPILLNGYCAGAATITISYDPYLLKRVISGNESWVYGYNVKSKASVFSGLGTFRHVFFS